MDELKRNGTLHLKATKQTYLKSALVVLTLLLASCVPGSSGGSKRSSGTSGISNTPSSVTVGYGRILHDNPVILSGNSSLSEDVNLSTLLKPTQDFITNSQKLSNTNCPYTDPSTGDQSDICYDIFIDKLSQPLQAVNGKWAYDPHSYEFMQVQMYSNMTSMFNKYNTDIAKYQSTVGLNNLDSAFRTSALFNRDHWFKKKLTGYAHCEDAPDNAFYSPADNIICLGYDSIYNQVKFVHDPTVLYHELGHALVLAALNVRNQDIEVKANLGYFAYDEAKSINEGLADYFSYYMNGRPFLGEWAFGRFLELGRPMSEADSLHAPGISETNEGRLSYPTFLSYNPNTPTKKYEDVHYAGQIISHFLVAFTKDIQNRCNFNNESARSLTFNLILETLGYLGDFSSTGLKDSTTEGRVNHSEEFSKEWLKANKPITFRRFTQTFSRFVYSSLSSSSAICNGTTYQKSYLEELLDSYGLLLFKNYDLGGSLFLASESDQVVSPLNRQKTVLIKKNQLFLDNRQNAVKAYVFDGYDDMNQAADYINDGISGTSLSPTIFENGNLKYNNGNSLISPGELVGVLLNVYNNSNSEIAGVRILSNDWDHMDNSSPCNNLADNFPSESQGGVNSTSNPACAIETLDNSTTAPVCFFQDSKETGTVWVSQDEFMRSRAIEATECLGGSQNTSDCLIRSPKGADVAWYSKIDPKKTWNETFTDENGRVAFKQSNLFFLEISPSVPPGTTVNCRLRATFTNCDDCNNYQADETGNEYTPHTNSSMERIGDEYKDYKYIGADPFVIINYQFTIID